MQPAAPDLIFEARSSSNELKFPDSNSMALHESPKLFRRCDRQCPDSNSSRWVGSIGSSAVDATPFLRTRRCQPPTQGNPVSSLSTNFALSCELLLFRSVRLSSLSPLAANSLHTVRNRVPSCFASQAGLTTFAINLKTVFVLFAERERGGGGVPPVPASLQ